MNPSSFHFTTLHALLVHPVGRGGTSLVRVIGRERLVCVTLLRRAGWRLGVESCASDDQYLRLHRVLSYTSIVRATYRSRRGSAPRWLGSGGHLDESRSGSLCGPQVMALSYCIQLRQRPEQRRTRMIGLGLMALIASVERLDPWWCWITHTCG